MAKKKPVIIKGYSWRKEFCKTCTFCIANLCREGPPTASAHHSYGCTDSYPRVRNKEEDIKENKACSKYEPKGK